MILEQLKLEKPHLFITLKCPLCNNEYEKYRNSNRKVCAKCTPIQMSRSMTGKRWKDRKDLERFKMLRNEELRVKEAHLKSIFVSDQESYYFSPEGDLL